MSLTGNRIDYSTSGSEATMTVRVDQTMPVWHRPNDYNPCAQLGSVGLKVSGSHDGFMIIAILGLISPGECYLWECSLWICHHLEACDMRRR